MTLACLTLTRRSDTLIGAVMRAKNGSGLIGLDLCKLP
jgi:hypothetical protein